MVIGQDALMQAQDKVWCRLEAFVSRGAYAMLLDITRCFVLC